MSKIFLIDANDVLRPMDETAYESENLLQTLLEKYPEVLAGHDSNALEEQRWLLVSREFGVPDKEEGLGRWSLDHLFLDQAGIPTLVEVKRATDTRARREVVAQMLDYAANAVVYWPVEGIRAKFEANCEGRGQDSGTQIRNLGSRFDSEDGSGIELFWQEVKTNLQAGRVRLVFVADRISSELQRIVEFLNEQMDPAEVIAVEVRQFIGKDVRTLVPNLVGRTAAALQKKSAATTESRSWDEESFLAALESRSDGETARVAADLLTWSRSNFDRISWGHGAEHGSFTPVLETILGSDGTRRKVNLFSVWTYGRVEIHFNYLAYRPPFDSPVLLEGFRQRLQEIPGVDLPEDSIERRPRFPIKLFSDQGRMKAFRDASHWAIKEVRRLASEPAPPLQSGDRHSTNRPGPDDP